MQNIRRITIVAALLSVALTAYAAPVSRTTAAEAARKLLGKPVVVSKTSQLEGCLLCVGADGKGFVLLSADDVVRPLLAYSATSTFDPEAMPAHVRQWVDGYRREIASAVALGVNQSQAVREEWQHLLAGTPKAYGSMVEPLLLSEWGQSPYYNALCPLSMPTGCVATAMAQIMYYWGHPTVGRGAHSYYSYGAQATLSANFSNRTYNWGAMPPQLTAASTDSQVEAVAGLMADIGVAVAMQYSPTGSGAYSSSYCVIDSVSAETAFRRHFLYDPGLHSVFKAMMSDAQWRAIATAELEAGRPIFYAGQGNRGGHAFVVDGVDTMQLFHVNWGWNGSYNGYYNLDSLVIGTVGEGYAAFNRDNEMLVGVAPVHVTEASYTLQGTSSNPSMGTVSGSGTLLTTADDTLLLATATPGCIFTGWASGAVNNPRMYTPTANLSDTAHFAPLSGDTLGYAIDMHYDWFGPADSGAVTWGIRLPMSVVARHKQLSQVQFYVLDTGLYQLAIYAGTMPRVSLYRESYAFDASGWQTITLEYPHPLYDTMPIWIILSTSGKKHVTLRSPYTGNPDGAWIMHDGQWMHTREADGSYGSWLIRAILTEADKVYLNLRSNDSGWGLVEGGGYYYPGDTATIRAIPSGVEFVFDHWSDGTTENPYSFVIYADLTITGFFSRYNGIDDQSEDGLTVAVEGHTLVVGNPARLEVAVYDMMGRQVAPVSSQEALRVTIPASGVYLVKAAGLPARRVAIVK